MLRWVYRGYVPFVLLLFGESLAVEAGLLSLPKARRLSVDHAKREGAETKVTDRRRPRAYP
jgi:hypothetical protein